MEGKEEFPVEDVAAMARDDELVVTLPRDAEGLLESDEVLLVADKPQGS